MVLSGAIATRIQGRLPEILLFSNWIAPFTHRRLICFNPVKEIPKSMWCVGETLCSRTLKIWIKVVKVKSGDCRM